MSIGPFHIGRICGISGFCGGGLTVGPGTLKLIKRQMYGRAKFDLLRQRVLYRG
jgi:hypothetical protein